MGLAKAHQGTNLEAGTICGSPLYMAPEILLRKPYNKDADTWSCGILLYKLVTGDFPFDGQDLPDLVQNIQKGVY